MEIVEQKDIDIICLQETWLRKCDAAIIEEIKEYNYSVLTERKPRKIDRGGGVAILYKSHIKIIKMKYKQYPSFESISVCMDNKKDQYVITNLYYPGYSMKHRFTHAAFLSDFEDLVENVICGNRKRIILGDFNIHTKDNSKPETLNLERILNKCSLILHETPKTHQLGGVIDLVISDENIVNEMSKPVVLSDYDDISDHYPVSLDIFFNPAGKKNKITVKCQKFSHSSQTRDIVANESQDLRFSDLYSNSLYIKSIFKFHISILKTLHS